MPITGPLLPGTLLRGKYRVERVLGRGGMGIVVLATHLRMSQRVAIKLLLPDHRGGDVVKRFAREARAASKLRGEHAVRILDVDDSEEGDPFLVMEYVEGTDLHQILRASGALPCGLASGYVLQACEGIAEAHALGIIHRDLKPANLFVAARPDGSPLIKILDFGISKLIDAENAADFLMTRPLAALGSPAYMSPEQLRDTADVDARTDLWSLGVVLYQLLTNALPFAATTTAALAARIAADPPAGLPPRVPQALGDVVLRCLEKDRERRFSDVLDLARALAPFASQGHAQVAHIALGAHVDSHRATTLLSIASPLLSPERDAASVPTASLHDVSQHEPLQNALLTEAATVVETTHASSAAPSRHRERWALAVLFAAMLIAVGWLGTRRKEPPVVAKSASSERVLVPQEPSSAGTVFLDGAIDAPPQAPPSGGVPLRRGRVPSQQPKPDSTQKNPMDIEFQ